MLRSFLQTSRSGKPHQVCSFGDKEENRWKADVQGKHPAIALCFPFSKTSFSDQRMTLLKLDFGLVSQVAFIWYFFLTLSSIELTAYSYWYFVLSFIYYIIANHLCYFSFLNIIEVRSFQSRVKLQIVKSKIEYYINKLCKPKSYYSCYGIKRIIETTFWNLSETVI